VNLIAIFRPCHESVEVASRFRARDVNDCHATMIPRL
jgi:hypothetical protein